MRLSFGRKLILICFTSTVVTGILSVAALRSISTLAGSIDTVVKCGAGNLDAVATVRSQVHEMSAQARAAQLVFAVRRLEKGENEGQCSGCHCVDSVAQTSDDLEAKVSAIRARVQQLRSQVGTDAAQATADEIDRGTAEWLASWQKFLPVAMADRYEEAHGILNDSLLPASHRVEKAAITLSEEQRTQMHQLEAQAQAEVSSNRTIAVILFIVSLLVHILSITVVLRTVSTLKGLAGNLSETTSVLAATADELAAGGRDLSDSANQQAAALEQTSASGQSVAETARRASSEATSAASLLSEVCSRIEGANKSLVQMAEAVDTARQSTSKVSHLAGTIEEIAFQTNLLALNASVEAARAGAAGAGFAIVATEVRNLSMRCTEAANDASSLIEQSMLSSDAGKSKLEEVRTAMKQVAKYVETLNGTVRSVEAGGASQAETLEEIAATVRTMQDVTVRIASSAEENSTAGGELTTQTGALREVVGKLSAMLGQAENSPHK